MQKELIQENIERVRDARIPDLITGAFQIFLTRLPVIAAAVSIINLPVALYYALYRISFSFPFSVSTAGELVIDETLLTPYYIELVIDLGIWLYLVLGTLAVAYVVELAVHGEYPDLNNVIGHAVGRWWAGLRTGMARLSLYLAIFLGATLLGTLVAVLLGGALGSTVGVAIGIGVSLLVAVVPLALITVMLIFDVYSASLREVGGREALIYSMRVSAGNWLRIVGVILAMLLLVNMPLQFIEFGLASLGVADMPLLQVVLVLLFNIIQAFVLTVYALVFLHFDYQKEEAAV